MLDEEGTIIFKKYKNALVAIGIDLSDESVIDHIENCNYELEAKFQAIIAYWYWLKTQDKELLSPNQLLIDAFHKQWQPIGWKKEFLENDQFKTVAEKWWEQARKVDILKNLIIDVKENFWSGGKIVFTNPNGVPWTMDLERAMEMSWQEIIEHYQRVTRKVIESYPGYFVFRDEDEH